LPKGKGSKRLSLLVFPKSDYNGALHIYRGKCPQYNFLLARKVT